jgi:hypothetical protein
VKRASWLLQDEFGAFRRLVTGSQRGENGEKIEKGIASIQSGRHPCSILSARYSARIKTIKDAGWTDVNTS